MYLDNTNIGDNMIDYYKKSIKSFQKYIREKPNTTKDEWDEYAQKNYLFSAQTLIFHLFNEELLKDLNKRNLNKFEYLKTLFL